MKRTVFVYRSRHDLLGSRFPLEPVAPPHGVAPTHPRPRVSGPAGPGGDAKIELSDLIAAIPLLGLETCWEEAVAG